MFIFNTLSLDIKQRLYKISKKWLTLMAEEVFTEWYVIYKTNEYKKEVI